jgi:lipid II:glycine glycyltransferase (peptidoglycan interpeptide bridge formation enzyme)
MEVTLTHDPHGWDEFIASEPWRPFLQSWTMGNVYADIGQKPVRLVAHDATGIIGVCFAHVVPARRGRHLSVPYGPVLHSSIGSTEAAHVTTLFVQELKNQAKKERCTFIRMSPFWPQGRHAKAPRSVTDLAI